MANYGGKEMRDLRKAAAATDSQIKNAGKKVGLEVWRVENKRTESDTPDFGIRRIGTDKDDPPIGEFYSGDSYIILNTYHPTQDGKVQKDKLAWDLHFWLGESTSIDERGVAAYKTVEIDDLLDDGAVQHRECQGKESSLFCSYFPEMKYLEGGIESGFRKVKPEEYEPRLFLVRKHKKTTRALQVECKASSMNHGDSFVLDAGLKIYLWVGESSNAFEKSKAVNLQNNIVNSRMGKAKKMNEIDDDFWRIVEGTEDDILPADHPSLEKLDKEVKMDAKQLKLYRISDASGSLNFELEAQGAVLWSQLDSDDVFIVDARAEIFVWIGNGATKQEKRSGFIIADQYIKDENLPPHTPITQVREGQVNVTLGSLLK